MPVYTCENTRNSATPNTISGVTIGTSIRPLAPVDSLPRQRCRPIAIATPSGVAISMHSAASFNVLRHGELQVVVVQDRRRRVAPVPTERRRLERRPAAPVVERDAHGDQHRQQRPQHVHPRDQREPSAAARLRLTASRAASSVCRPLLTDRGDQVVHHQHEQAAPSAPAPATHRSAAGWNRGGRTRSGCRPSRCAASRDVR